MMKSLFRPLLLALTSALCVTSAQAQSIDPNTPVSTGGSLSRPIQLGAPPPPPIVIPALSMDEVRLEMQTRLLKIPGVRFVAGLDGSPNVLRLISHSDMSIRLDNLLTRLNAQGADRPAELARFENNVRTQLERTDPFKPEQLRVVIRKTAAINAFETETIAGGVANPVVRRPFMDDLEEVVVGDAPTAIAFMPVARLGDLQLTSAQAFERGRANTASAVTGLTWSVVNGLNVVRISDGYETSLLAIDQVWPSIATRLGGPIAIIVPTREKLVIGRADRPRDIARLRAMALAEATGDRAMSAKVWVRRGAAWVAR